jgi:2-isopropylmalate synthase
VDAGATMVQGTMNGYGERNGNANLTTVIANLALKMNSEISCGRNIGKLRDLSILVDDLANLRPDIKAPYVGASSFAHKGGVHANAAAKVSRSYEHIDPLLVGNRQRVLISDMSGRSSVMMKAHEIGVDLDDNPQDLQDFIKDLKDLEYKGYEFEAADASFELLLSRWLQKKKEFFEVIGYRVIVERDEVRQVMLSEATVKLKVDGEIHHEVAETTGPVGALDHALRKALEKSFPSIGEVTLSDFKVRILDSGEGADARIRVQIESTDGKEIWGTVGASDNIIEASWEALKDSVEFKLHKEQEKDTKS